jgi:O-antigen ligase
MTKQEIHTKAHNILAILIAFTFPFARLSPLFIVLMFLNWLIEGDFKNKFSKITSNKFALLFIAFYSLHLIGLLFTQNLNAGIFDIQVKLSLLFFPLMIVSRPFDKEKTKKIFYSLIFGIIISSFILLFIASYTYFTKSLIRFFYQEFSLLLHPSYISMYINVCIAWLLLNIYNGKYKENRFSKTIVLVLITFLSFINILMSSKMGLLTMVIIFVSFLIYYVVKKRKYLSGLFGITTIVILSFSALKFFPEMAGRVNRSIDAITHPTTNETESESTVVRFLIWHAANNVIAENFLFGVGTGDAKDVLLVQYKKLGMNGALEHKLNAHNEFLQVFISLGLFGFIFLILSLILPLFYAIKMNNGMYLLFLVIVILNFFPESMLETQAGVMFYAFFNSVLCFEQQPITNN